ncbi:hypothetical protein CC80DRAFT_24595 [Byssothecium circinans]|uniref:Uncharacterized protein n=1 Tax=Byssothecium circinans TaxID=147558 RepID=A0A6A5T5A2_9PLEO|nr:hypothetical protein CC80DRAFT_24595 [Byssothecium circinans]
MELGRRLKRLFIRRVLRKTLRDKCGELRDLLSTADGSDQTSLHQLSALAENPVRVWKSGLNAINNVLNDVLPKSTQEVISLILMADSMRSVPHLSGGELCGLNEFIHDLHRWKQTINLGDLTIFETFARVMYRLRIDEHVSPSPPMKLLQHFQKSLRDIISQMPVPAQSNAEIPIFPDSCGNQAGSPNTSISWSKLPIIRWDPGDPDLNFYFKVERPIFHAVSRSTAAVVGTVIFGVVLACLLSKSS